MLRTAIILIAFITAALSSELRLLGHYTNFAHQTQHHPLQWALDCRVSPSLAKFAQAVIATFHSVPSGNIGIDQPDALASVLDRLLPKPSADVLAKYKAYGSFSPAPFFPHNHLWFKHYFCSVLHMYSAKFTELQHAAYVNQPLLDNTLSLMLIKLWQGFRKLPRAIAVDYVNGWCGVLEERYGVQRACFMDEDQKELIEDHARSELLSDYARYLSGIGMELNDNCKMSVVIDAYDRQYIHASDAEKAAKVKEFFITGRFHPESDEYRVQEKLYDEHRVQKNLDDERK